MFKNKKFLIIMAVFVMSTALFIGCTSPEEDLQEDDVIGQIEENLDTEEVDGSEDAVITDDNENIDNNGDANEEQSQITTSKGTLMAINADEGTVTITTDDGIELVLNVTSESEVLIDGALLSPAQLADKTDSQVTVEYQTETNTINLISIEE